MEKKRRWGERGRGGEGERGAALEYKKEDDPLDQKKKCGITPNFEQSLYEQMGARTGDIVHDTADVGMINIPPPLIQLNGYLRGRERE
jgi:hypothetical protein